MIKNDMPKLMDSLLRVFKKTPGELQAIEQEKSISVRKYTLRNFNTEALSAFWGEESVYEKTLCVHTLELQGAWQNSFQPEDVLREQWRRLMEGLCYQSYDFNHLRVLSDDLTPSMIRLILDAVLGVVKEIPYDIDSINFRGVDFFYDTREGLTLSGVGEAFLNNKESLRTLLKDLGVQNATVTLRTQNQLLLFCENVMPWISQDAKTCIEVNLGYRINTSFDDFKKSLEAHLSEGSSLYVSFNYTTPPEVRGKSFVLQKKIIDPNLASCSKKQEMLTSMFFYPKADFKNFSSKKRIKAGNEFA